MLIQFRFRNYRSYRDETILDMRSCRMTEYSYVVREVDGNRLLPVTAIYGANSSGKSNLIRAFSFMTDWVLCSLNHGDSFHPFEPCLLCEDVSHSSSEFEVFFTSEKDGKTVSYDYGFILDKDVVLEEWLNMKKSRYGRYNPIFYREKNSLDDDSLLGKHVSAINECINRNVLLLSLADKLSSEILKPVYSWFSENRIINSLDVALPDISLLDKSLLVNFLSLADSTIRDIESSNGRNYVLHQFDGSDAHMIPVSLSDESSGINKLLTLYGPILDVLESGGVLFVDDLDVSLHPILLRYIGLMFSDPEKNPGNAQLIFTTNDSWQLDNDSLRRDQVWFVEKNSSASCLFSLAEFKTGNDSRIRKDENHQKNYMLGKYGAIPHFEA